MANATQFIGSKISLISKSEIRYEGILYSLDVVEATISLAKVKSFGTEDRPTERPVPPKDEIYEFIIFRGSDIKGIDVVEPPKPTQSMSDGVHNDPAIVEVSHYHSAPSSRTHNSSTVQPPIQSPGYAVNSMTYGANAFGGPGPSSIASAPPPKPATTHSGGVMSSALVDDSSSNSALLETSNIVNETSGSNVSTPAFDGPSQKSQLSKSQTHYQQPHSSRGERQGGRGERHGGRGDMHGGRGDLHGGRGDVHGGRGDLHGGRADMHVSRGDMHGSRGDLHGSRGEQHESRGEQHGNRGEQHGNRSEQHGNRGEQHGSRSEYYGSHGEHHGNRSEQHGSRGERGIRNYNNQRGGTGRDEISPRGGRGRGGMNGGGRGRPHEQGFHQNKQESTDYQPRQQGQGYQPRGRGAGAVVGNYNNTSRGGGGFRGSDGFRRGGGYRTQGILRAPQSAKVTFDNDFDFEKANEELQTAIKDLKLTEKANEIAAANAEVGHNVLHHEAEEQENKEPASCYKKDDFFDSISCEALERGKGQGNRPDWRAERKLNAETFGLSGQRRGGGGYYRGGGRGYYNNRGGGGYNGGYSGGGHRGYNNSRGGYSGYNNRYNGGSGGRGRGGGSPSTTHPGGSGSF